MVAGAIKQLSGWENDILFSSGVSNSGETDSNLFRKEIDLVLQHLTKLPQAGTFVYFSTTSIFDPNRKMSHYIRHKLFIESLIKASNKKFLIVRLPNLVGSSLNPHTLTNYFAESIRLEKPINLNEAAIRHLIDVADLSYILNDIKERYGKNKLTVNVETDRPLSALEILHFLEDVIKKKAHVNLSRENPVIKNIRENTDIVALNYLLSVRGDYHKQMMKKYYSS